MKTVYSGRLMSIDSEMLELLKSWRRTNSFWRQRLGIRESGQAGTSSRFLPLGLEGVSAGGNPGGHWETRDALTSTQRASDRLSWSFFNEKHASFLPSIISFMRSY